MPPPRRRFRFSLRTFFVVVAVLGVGCAGVAWQVRIVHERNEVLELIRHQNDQTTRLQFVHAYGVPMPFWKLQFDEPRVWRHWLGEQQTITEARYSKDVTASTVDRVRAAFPEAIFEPWPE